MKNFKKPYFALLRIFTIPFWASTSTKSPSFRTLVAILVPMIQGILSSRETMAAWQVMPPTLVTIAEAFLIAGIKSGLVASDTKISPFLIFLYPQQHLL